MSAVNVSSGNVHMFASKEGSNDPKINVSKSTYFIWKYDQETQ